MIFLHLGHTKSRYRAHQTVCQIDGPCLAELLTTLAAFSFGRPILQKDYGEVLRQDRIQQNSDQGNSDEAADAMKLTETEDAKS